MSPSSVRGVAWRKVLAGALCAVCACTRVSQQPASFAQSNAAPPVSASAHGSQVAVAPPTSNEAATPGATAQQAPRTSAVAWLPPKRAVRRVPKDVKTRIPTDPAPPLPEGTTVLHIGDSFAGALGIALNRELEEHGVRGLLRYRTSSYIPEWAYSDELWRFIINFHPDLVLITLGANEIEIAEPEQRASAVKKLVHELKGRPCVWIAPPLWQRDNGLMRVIRENCAPCRFMDTNAYIEDMPRVKDGIHPTTEARVAWAKVVLDWLARERQSTPSEPWALRQE